MYLFVGINNDWVLEFLGGHYMKKTWNWVQNIIWIKLGNDYVLSLEHYGGTYYYKRPVGEIVIEHVSNIDTDDGTVMGTIIVPSA